MRNYLSKNKDFLYVLMKSFFIGALVGFIIRYFRDVALAPAICGVGAMLYGVYNYKNSIK